MLLKQCPQRSVIRPGGKMSPKEILLPMVCDPQTTKCFLLIGREVALTVLQRVRRKLHRNFASILELGKLRPKTAVAGDKHGCIGIESGKREVVRDSIFLVAEKLVPATGMVRSSLSAGARLRHIDQS